MSTPFDPHTPVNGGMLKQFAGQTVSIMAQLESVAGTNVVANSTDNHKLRVSLPSEAKGKEGAWVEIIGVPSSGDAIRGKDMIKFRAGSVDFDSESYNTMVQLLNNVKDFYPSG